MTDQVTCSLDAYIIVPPLLRAYQRKLTDDIRDAFRSGYRRPLAVLPTGGGKTVIFCNIVATAAGRGRSVLLICHRSVIVEQIVGELAKFGINAGIIAAGHTYNPTLPVNVGMQMTVHKRMRNLPIPGLVIIDEAHRACGRTYREILEHYTGVPTLFFTATPARTDGKGLGDVSDAMVLGPSTRWLIDNGFLSQYRLFVPPPLADLSTVRRTAGDYNKRMLQDVMDVPTITGDALEHYKRVSMGRRFVAFTTGTQHSEDVAAQFTAGGVPTRNIDGTMEREHVHSVLHDLEEGKILGVTSCDLISEGFDLPAVETAILLRPTMSKIVYLQQVGRVLRRSVGKTQAIILDHVGNSFRFNADGSIKEIHGKPCAEREWSLEGSTKDKNKKAEITISSRRCEQCQLVYSASLSECPYCGEAVEVNPRVFSTAEGELIEIGHEQKIVNRILETRSRRKWGPVWALREASKQLGVTYKEAALALGYKPGFIYIMGLQPHDRHN